MRNNITLKIFNVVLSLTCVSAMFSCTGTKFLSENESFYTGAEINFEQHGRVRGKKDIRRDLEESILTKPNTTILGMRPGVWFYYIAGNPEKQKGFRYWMKHKLGEEPVLLKDVEPERNANVLQGNLINRGYFESQVTSQVKTKNKKSKVIYTVQLYPPFRIRDIHYPTPKDSVYRAVVKQIQEDSYIKPKQRYDLNRLKAEQERIEALLENFGFYYFDDSYLIYQADSTVGHHQVDLYLKLESDIPQKAKRIYRMSNVNVITDFSFSEDSIQTRADTVHVNGYNYIRKEDKFRPETITDVINLQKGNIYTRDAHEYTLSHLMSLGAFKFVNIKYNETDSAQLDANIYLTPLLKKSIRLETQAVSKSNNFVGPGIGVRFTNRNFLKGSELFEFNLNTSYEWQISRQQSGPLNAFELDLETTLTVPRFISPLNIHYYSTKYIPQTKFKLGFNLQRRIHFFQLNSFNASYGYIWRETTAKSHEFYPIDLNFVQLNKTSPAFDALLEQNPVLANSFQDQFIMGGRYSYTLNTQLSEKRQQEYGPDASNLSNYYLNARAGFAGNIIHTLQKKTSSEEPLQLFGSPYSQFVLGEVDFRYYRKLDRHSMLATRLDIGAGYAYGNSTHLPYIKQFTAGGSNSIRAFPARSVGPGTYNVREDPDYQDTNVFFIDQRGDAKLEMNVEYRFDIFKSFKGAVFTDAGNIWTWQEDPERPGSEFDKDTFLKELAVGTGAGIRFDLKFFVIRFDVAFPIRKPYLPENNRWVFDQIDFSSAIWRRQNLVYNIAIGYPF